MDRVAGLDVHRDRIKACARVPGEGADSNNARANQASQDRVKFYHSEIREKVMGAGLG